MSRLLASRIIMLAAACLLLTIAGGAGADPAEGRWMDEVRHAPRAGDDSVARLLGAHTPAGDALPAPTHDETVPL